MAYNHILENINKNFLFSMDDFWTNIARYPRFFISSLLGLIFIILTPIRNLFKNKKSRIVLIIFCCIFLITISLILINMLAI